jgi:tungstate transport system ATP-binding protein
MKPMHGRASILPLRVRSLTFEAGGRRLIDGMSFELGAGGITTIIGPNGAGKSLLLRLCHGLIAPHSGLVEWALPGGRLAGRSRHGMVFQRPVMLRRSLAANIAHALAAAGFGGRQRVERVAAALERFGLGHLADRPARVLSGGEQQRLAIARAWSLAPELLFLDEPSSQLDPGATRQIEAIITELAAEGMTIVMATHDLGQARRLARGVMFLDRGRLVEHAPAERFFAAPGTNAARAFLAGDLLW